ncbi:sulfotransferase family [Micractinium conductrix]|uniref:Sulfotransferase family n=1 Tax=Micractinium conductrix TaxID=554055 RepID=A0A2P6VHG7_9CHLO|nr:sulfotransferase family [Micractinium conductrix]|eukprot:PSC73525.1 sulfotransferase family [Micractinium conductrix]
MAAPRPQKKRWLRALLGLVLMAISAKVLSQLSFGGGSSSGQEHQEEEQQRQQYLQQAAAERQQLVQQVGQAQCGASLPTVAALVESFVTAPTPARNTNVSLDAPLIFFHQRKTAGTSMRRAIRRIALGSRQPFYIPCNQGVHCDTYHIGNASAKAFYAGHFYWGELRELSRRAKFLPPGAHWDDPRHRASCFTIFREPLARMESCYYYRFIQERGIKNKHFSCLDQLNPVELRRMFMDGRSKFARGCLNEPFRILSGLTDEEDLAALSSAAPDQGWQLTAAMALTLQHLAQCVPVVLERPESLRLMRHYFPQLTPGLDSLQHANALKVGRCPLSDATRSLLAELSVGEHILYEAVQRRVDYMLAELGEEGEQQQEEEQR